MPLKVRKATVNLKDVRPHPDLEPKRDPTFLGKFKLAIKGQLPTYFAQIPLRLIRPFDAEFLPHQHPDAREIFDHMVDEIVNGKAPVVWVYPQDGMFILSDDYLLYEASRMAQVDSLPCFVLGEPNAPGVEEVEGPLDVMEVREALGIRM